MTRPSKAGVKVLTEALRDTLRRWEQRRRNLEVAARARPGAWPDMPPEQARRKLNALRRKIAALRGIAAVYGIELPQVDKP